MSGTRLLRLALLVLAFAATSWLSETSAHTDVEIGVRSEGQLALAEGLDRLESVESALGFGPVSAADVALSDVLGQPVHVYDSPVVARAEAQATLHDEGAPSQTSGSANGAASLPTPTGDGATTLVSLTLTPSSSRGPSNLGGVIEENSSNAAGVRIFTSTGPITQNDFAGIVQSDPMREDDVHILTGAHGFANGRVVADATLLSDDIAAFGRLPGVYIHDLPSMSPAEVRAILDGSGTIIGGFCDSGSCLAPYRRGG